MTYQQGAVQDMPQQVQRVPQLRMQQMPPRGPPIRGQQLRGQLQGQTFLQTNPDGTQQRVFVRPQQMQFQQPQLDGQGQPQMIRGQVTQPGQFVRGQAAWNIDGQQQLVRAPQQMVMSPAQQPLQQQHVLQQQNQQLMWQQPQQQQQQQPSNEAIRRGPGGRLQGPGIQRFTPPHQQHQQVNPDQIRAPVTGGQISGAPQVGLPAPPIRHAPPPQSSNASSLQPLPQPHTPQVPQSTPSSQTLSSVSTSLQATGHSSSSAPSSSSPLVTRVTPKTKTALANLLNTRLQNNGGLNRANAAANGLQLDSAGSHSNGTNSNSSSNNSTPTSISAPANLLALSGDGTSPSAVFNSAAVGMAFAAALQHQVGAVSATVASFSPAKPGTNKIACVGAPGVVRPASLLLSCLDVVCLDNPRERLSYYHARDVLVNLLCIEN